MKHLSLDISSCKKCPHRIEDISPTIGYCELEKDIKTNLAPRIPDYPNIPDWCPLPDKEIKKNIKFDPRNQTRQASKSGWGD